MELRQIWHALRRRWRAIISVCLLVVAVAALFTLLSPNKYVASSQIFVSVRDGSSTSDLVSGNTYAQSQVQSYVDVISSPLVLQPVITAQKLPKTPDELKDDITVSVPDRTVLMNVSVTNTDPETAALIANGINKEFVAQVGKLETNNSRGGSPVKVTILKSATVPDSPVSPEPIKNIAVGLILGLVLGMAVAVLREYFDNSVRTEGDITRVTSLPIIGAIPFDKQAPKNPLISQAGIHTVRAEAFRSVRTNLQFVQAGVDRKSFVVTSSLPSEGKTTTTANLALTLAAVGARVCVIEGDLRKPRLLEYMGLDNGVGLTSILIGQAELGDVLQQFGGTNLWVLGSGPIPPNPSELLGSEPMEELIRKVEGDFDYVLVDAPPMLPVTDAAVISRIVGSTVIVTGFTRVTRSELARTLGLLEAVDATTVGLIANLVPSRGPYAHQYYREGYFSDLPDEGSGPAGVAAPLRRTARFARE